MAPRMRYQPRDHAPRAIAERHEKAIGRQFKQALVHLRSLVKTSEIAELLKKGGKRDAVERAIGLAHFKETLKEPFNALGVVIHAAGDAGAEQITRAFKKGSRRVRYGAFTGRHHGAARRRGGVVLRKAVGDGFAFDRFDEGTQDKIRQYQDELIVELEAQARDVIEQAVMDGTIAGDSAEEIAAVIRDVITLTGTQATAVENFRQLLEAGDPAALDRALRDTSYDNLVEQLIDGEDVADKIINDMVDAYAENYLDYRADTIASTESMRAANLGLHEAYSQAIDRGVFPSDAVKRSWLLALDERTCDICASVPDSNPDEGVGVDEPFQSIDGEIDDPPVHPSCRCSIEYVTDLDALPDDQEQDDTVDEVA